MADRYPWDTDGVTTPARKAVAVIPHDTNTLDAPKAIYVGSGGTIVMRGIDDDVDTVWEGVPAGSMIAFRPKFIRATGTTAAKILALY